MAGAKIALSSTSGELQNDGNDNARVNLPTTATQAGFAQLAYAPSASLSKVGKVTEDNALYCAELRQILDIDFNSTGTAWSTKIGTNATTMTKAVQNGFMRLNNSAITTTTTGIAIYSNRVITIETGYEYVIKFQLKHANANATNKQAEFGLGYYNFAAGQANAMNEFVGFRYKTDGSFVAVLATSAGGAAAETETALSIGTDNVAKEYAIVLSDTAAEFWIDGVYQTRIAKGSGVYGNFKAVAYPFIARVFNSGAASDAATFDIANISAIKVGPDDGIPHPYRMAAMGKSSYYGQPDVLAAATTPHLYPASGTAPTPNVGSNTASAANNTALLGGLIGNTLTGVTVTLSTNVLWTSWQNPAVPPAAGAGNNARNFYVTGISISNMIVTAALTGGGFTAAWFAAFGHTNISLATTDADGTTAVAQKAPRIVPLPLLSTLAAAAALATISTDVGDHQFQFPTPLVVHPGGFLAIGFRTIAVTAAVTVGAAQCNIGVNGYWD